ncbi:MAG TPA: hypothetical protein VFF28_05930 [Candidatus Nanoarchaeia archaeon]|nr:hypothetical protein [Candidatus Nanoarchaeia archaeon]
MATSYTCSVCKRKFAFEQIRYSQNGSHIVCKGCYVSCVEEKPSAVRIEVPIMEPTENKFRCLGCGYRFSIKKESMMARSCPYCGKASSLISDNISAQSIINSVR